MEYQPDNRLIFHSSFRNGGVRAEAQPILWAAAAGGTKSNNEEGCPFERHFFCQPRSAGLRLEPGKPASRSRIYFSGPSDYLLFYLFLLSYCA
jgi:hypothetical protein